jgi:hypothetical protein
MPLGSSSREGNGTFEYDVLVETIQSLAVGILLGSDGFCMAQVLIDLEMQQQNQRNGYQAPEKRV